ncbi:MAG: hypothetical protein ACM3VS_08240 [Candidatus Dadabacteria bacterium]
MNRTALLTIIILLITACNHKVDKTAVALVHGYFYYPKPNVYYDTTEKTFIYFDSSSANWKKGNLPIPLQSDLGKSVLITNPSSPVWNENKEHRLIYSVALYADSSDFKRREDTENKSFKEKPDNKTAQQDNTSGEEVNKDKKRTKVGEFLHRLFGNKKDDK